VQASAESDQVIRILMSRVESRRSVSIESHNMLGCCMDIEW